MDDTVAAGDDSATAVGAEPAVGAAVDESRSSRRLRVLELLLVVGFAYLPSTVGSIRAWVLNQPPTPDTGWRSIGRILDVMLVIALLAYVLYRQGRSLRSLGLTA